MKIRSITYFLNPGMPLDLALIKRAGDFVAQARASYESVGYEVQTTRLATVPFPFLVPSLDDNELCGMAKNLEISALDAGFDYVSLGPALPELPESFKVVPAMIQAAEKVFLSGLMTSDGGYISLPAVKACADIIYQVAKFSNDGFSNLRFGAAANVSAGGPFFPVSYQDFRTGDHQPRFFALATEAADLAIEAARQSDSLAKVRGILIHLVESHAARLTRVSEELADQEKGTHHAIRFGGIDFTLAPFPRVELSFGTAIEQMGVPAVGMHGSLAAAAFLTYSLDLAKYQRAGFNGLMLPLLEDAVLALRAEQGNLNLNDLLLYSAVCGTGLDTIPLPGDISREQLTAILLDLSALAQRLDKPLIARLMPIPGKAAGELTSFDFDFFANSRVQAVRSDGIENLLAGDETFRLAPR
ncbi:MAG: DUF711 family protein [Anaerolineales bacterium]|nr:DUF711 family protein [Anaerolineales bacterium]